MALANTHATYGSVAKSLHWLTALLILTVIPLGIVANGMAHDIRDPTIATTDANIARTALLFSIHKTIGVIIFFVALIRIVWAIRQPKPGLLNADKRLEATAAETVHWLLYGSLLLVPLTGWVHHAAATGFAPIWWPFGQSLPFVPKSEPLAELSSTLHIVFERVLIVSIFLHVAGALKHHVVDRDATLRRMLPGTPALPSLPQAHGSKAVPVILALSAWGAALAVAAGMGLFAPHGHGQGHSQTAETPRLETPAPAAGDLAWTVSEGTLAIAVQQMGSQVDGLFSDWQAQISFQEPDAPGPAGKVSVTVAIGSLTLGSVTDQAMGPDFFDAGTFPTALFEADIVKTETGYEARGPLTIKGTTVPVVLPFTLELADDTARMTGALTLLRQEFGIGASMTDAASLGMEVEVAIALTATRVATE